jgi:hypothetical protein
MVMLREEPLEKEEDDPEPEPDIVPSCRRDQQCHDREEKLFLFTAILCVATGLFLLNNII